MGNTIDIYIKYAGPPLPLALRVAGRLEAHAFFYGGDYVWIPVDAARWIGTDGWGLLSLDAEYQDDAGTAIGPYEYCLSLEYRGSRERLGRTLFAQLTALGVPLLVAGALVLDLLGRLRDRAGPRPLDADRVVAALQQHVLRADEDIEVRRNQPDAVEVRTRRATYRAQRADWLVTRMAWMPGVVRDAVRVIAREGIGDTVVWTYGLIFERHHQSENTLFLNDVTGLWTLLGRWLGVGLDPLAFAELVAEFYSGPDIAGPVVAAPAVSTSTTAGGLIRDVSAFVSDHPSVDPALIAAPTVREQDGAVEMEFCSYHRYPSGSTTAVDVLSWRVVGAAGKDVTWMREYVARRLEHP
jgi:hypothetical protein